MPHMSNAPVVLIVDDDPIALVLMEQILASTGARIHRARDGERALQLIRKLRPDAVVLDLLLPVMSGARVLAAIHEERLEVPVVLVSGAARAPVIGSTLEFVPKPCDPDELRGAVVRAIARSPRRTQP